MNFLVRLFILGCLTLSPSQSDNSVVCLYWASKSYRLFFVLPRPCTGSGVTVGLHISLKPSMVSQKFTSIPLVRNILCGRAVSLSACTYQITGSTQRVQS